MLLYFHCISGAPELWMWGALASSCWLIDWLIDWFLLFGRVALRAQQPIVIKLSRVRSVGLCVGLSSALWKNGESDPDVVWHHRSNGSGDEAIGTREGVLTLAAKRPSSEITLGRLVITVDLHSADFVIACSYRWCGQDKTVLSCLCRRCEHNCRQDKIV